MEAIRKIQTVENGEVHITLPKEFWGQKVEIIVLNTLQKELQRPQKKSLRGCLHHYANPALVVREKVAWQDAISEKYDNN